MARGARAAGVYRAGGRWWVVLYPQGVPVTWGAFLCRATAEKRYYALVAGTQGRLSAQSGRRRS